MSGQLTAETPQLAAYIAEQRNRALDALAQVQQMLAEVTAERDALRSERDALAMAAAPGRKTPLRAAE